MHFENETGMCDHVSYEVYYDMKDQLTKENKKLQEENEDLKQQLLEHKKVIQELKKLGEAILKSEK